MILPDIDEAFAKQVGAGKAGPITRKMQELYFGLFSGKTEDRWNWLDPVA